jgi:hypothetical protein
LLAWPQIAGTRLVERQLLGNGCEQLLHVLARLGRGFKEEKAGLAGILLGVGRLYGALIGRLGDEIELVAGQRDDDVLIGLALQLLDPRFGLVQRRLRSLLAVSLRRPRARRGEHTACVMS